MFNVALVALAVGAPFKLTATRADDRVTAAVEKGRTVVDVTSPKGIGGVTVERAGETWPDRVVVRLRLATLEQFDATNGTASLKAGVLSHSGHPLSLSVNDKPADPSDPKGPYYLDFKMVGKDGKPAAALPLRGGYFELTLPKPLFDGNPRSVTLHWIDAFRR